MKLIAIQIGLVVLIVTAGISGFAQGCSLCSGGGTSQSPNGEASFSVSMGPAAFGQPTGKLFASTAAPDSAIYTPASLQFSAWTRSDVLMITNPVVTTNVVTSQTAYLTNVVVTNTFTDYASVTITNTYTNQTVGLGTTSSNILTTNWILRQVKAPQALADIPTPPTTNGYVINFYYTSNVGGPSGGLYTFTGAPYMTWIVTNPSPASNVQIQVSKSNATDGLIKQWNWAYSTASGTWSNQSLSGIVQINNSVTNLGSGKYQVTASYQTNGGPIVHQVTTTYQSFSWGGAPIEVDIGSGSSLQSTKYTYYDPPRYGATGSPAPIDTITYPNGSMDTYVYTDASGLPYAVASTFGDDPYGRFTYYDYTTNNIGGSGDDGSVTNVSRFTVVVEEGNQVSRTYTVFPTDGVRIDIQCTNWMGAWDDSGNLFTTNIFYTSGGNQGALQAIIHPNHTLTTYDYATNSAGTYQTNITATGQADPTFSYVVDGTSNYTVVDLFGNLVLDVSVDVASGILLSEDIYGNPDGYGRPQQVTHLDGTTEYTSYACCGLDSTTDRDGVVTEYLYDAAKRQTGYIKNFGTDTITYTNVLDAAGQVLQSIRIGTDASQILLKQTAYDLAGEVLYETNALGGVTSFIRGTNLSTGGLIRATIYPDGGTQTNYYYADGTLKRTDGTAVRPTAYVYGSDGGDLADQFTITYKLSASGGSNEWVKNISDMPGRPVETLYSSESGSPAAYFNYNSLGQLTNTVDPDNVSTVYVYNARGERAYSVVAIDTGVDHNSDFSGADRITYTVNDVTNDSGRYVHRAQTFVWSANGSSTSSLVSTVENSTDGLKSWSTIWNNGNPITSTNIAAYGSSGYRYATNLAPDGSYTVSTYRYGRLLSTTRKNSGGTQISDITFGYDAHGRQSTAADARNGTTTYSFNNQDQVSGITSPSPGGGGSAEVTSNYFDNMGRIWKTTQPDSTSVTNLFYLTGDLMMTYGSRTYPVGYGYDAQGRMTRMTNWSSFPSDPTARVTSWSYYSHRGFLRKKTYPDSSGPSYEYTAAGRLYKRKWARGVTTTYAYDAAGGLYTVDYSDGTPGVAYTYDRRGRQTQTVQGGAVTTTLTYNDQGQVLTEVNSGGPLDGVSITNGYDNLLRRTNLVTRTSGVLTSNYYGYDGVSRLLSVADANGDVAGYSYLANSPLVSQIAFTNGSTLRMTTTKTYDYLNRLTGISSTNSVVLDSHNYHYNSANQRTSVTNADGTYWAYQYDALGQVTSGVKHWADGTPVAGQQFGYGFDDIGNRKVTSAGGDQSGANLRYENYGVNSLNQYTNRTVPGAVDIIGSATNTATVTVNNTATYRHSNYFRAQLPLTNGSSPVWQVVTNLAVLNEGGSDVRQTNINGNVYLPQTPENFTYDADGNLTQDGRWNYTWDAENRLIGMTNISNVPDGAKMGLAFAYDAKSRRIQKTVSTWSVSTYVAQSTNSFVYDAWNLLAMLNTPAAALVESFTWGLDLSGSMQGAGGVGGLLAVSYHGGSTTNCFPTHDGNGNVTALANAADGTIAANYEYGTFGEVIRDTGPMAKANPFRFSTKYQDDENDLVYYGYRYYDASAGRWLNRDPIEERGGISLYGFVQNNPFQAVDALGLQFSPSLSFGFRTPPFKNNQCEQGSSTFVAKSFINGIPDIGNFDRYGAGSLLLIPSQWRLDAFSEFTLGLNAFNQNPFTSDKDGAYRLYTRVTITASCCCGRASNVKLDTDKDGGAEILGLSGSINLSSDIAYNASSAMVTWTGWGRPNIALEPGMQAVGFRSSVNIWHEVRVRISCDKGKPKFSLNGKWYSHFPSFRLWQDGQQIASFDQGAFSNLWGSGPVDSDMVNQ